MSYLPFMFTSKDYEKMATQLVKKVGIKDATRLLVLEGVSPHTANKILHGRYGQPIGKFVGRVLRDVLEKKVAVDERRPNE